MIDLVRYSPPFMNINHAKKCIYFETAKCCTSAIKTGFGIYDAPNQTTEEWTYIHGKECEYNSYFKFGFCRNPITRICSAYNMLNSTGQPLGFPKCSFREFVLHVTREQWKNDHWIKQIDLLPENLDFLGRFENFAEDWKYIAKKFDFQQKLPLFRHGKQYDYKEFYQNNEDLYKIVADYYHEDMKRFGYSLQSI